MKRATALVLLAVLSLVASPLVATATATEGYATAADRDVVSADLTPLSYSQANETTTTATNNSTETTTPSAPGERPESADAVRILPVQLEEDFVSVETDQQGARYNTSGPFVFFSLSEPVDQVAIQQPKAQATVLEGGRVVKVEYEDDAAPVGESSLYELDLFFEDGSSKTVELYAEQTSVSTGSAELKKYRPLIMDMLNDAQKNNFERSPDGAEAHYEAQKEDAQLLNSLFTEKAKRLFGSIAGIVANPLGIALILISAALLALWQIRKNGDALDFLSNDSGKAARKRERLWIEYKKQQQTAADEPLRDVIGEMDALYWRDAYGVDSVAGLAELFRTGLPIERDGEIQHVGGAEELEAETISASWLEAVCRDNRIPSPELALADGKKVLHRMVSKYGMGHVYQDDLERVRELIDELDESREVTQYANYAGGTGVASAAGGDD